MGYEDRCDFSTLRGLTLTKVSATGDEMRFEVDDGRTFKLSHYQDCCESVTIDDIAGNLDDLVGAPILMAEEVSNEDVGFLNKPKDDYDESFTWTFYKLATVKGYVTIRWYGESNGYYSESVDFEEVK